MKKKFKLNEIDCANCALKLEESIKEISGVKDAKVNYMMQKLTVEADEADMDGVVEKVLAAVCLNRGSAGRDSGLLQKSPAAAA